MIHKLNRSTQLLLIIMAVAVILRISAAFFLGDTLDPVQQARIYDQISYNTLALSLLDGKGFSFPDYWYPFSQPNTPTAHWSFAYPLFLAGVYAFTGFHPLAARLVQAIISGVLAIWLFYRLGKQVYGEINGLVTASLGAVYIYFIYHDAALMTESFYILGVLAMLLISQEIDQKDSSLRNWAMLGLILGISATLRQSILVWVPFLMGWFIWASKWRIPWKGFTTTILAMLMVILPWTLRNYYTYHAFLLLNSNAGYALYAANHPDHGMSFDQDYVAPLPDDLDNKYLNEAQWSTLLTVRGVQFILSEPIRFLKLSASRFFIFFNGWFSPDSNLSSNLMRVLSFGVYLPFFVTGLLVSLHDWRRYSLLYLFSIVYSAMHIFTWASIRYRLPVDAAMMPFAALTILFLVQKARLHLHLSPT